jgi:hypothetical protein
LARDKDKLDKLARVEFSWSDIVDLAEVASAYAERANEPPLPGFLLQNYQYHQPSDLAPRREFMMGAEWIWRDRLRTSEPGFYSSRSKRFDGPLLRLLQYLFEVVGEPPPSPSTLVGELKAFPSAGAGHRGPQRRRRNRRRKTPATP